MGRVAAALVVFLLVATPALAAFPATPPNDPLYEASSLPNAANEQWNLQSPSGGFDRGISLDRVWPTVTGDGVVMAMPDTGVPFEHEDLRGQWATNPGESGVLASNGVDDDGNGYVDDWRGWDFFTLDNDAEDDTAYGHGAVVAGILGAAADNGRGLAGVAPDARILPVRDHDTILPHPDRLAQSVVYAVDRGADVISMSLGAIGNSSALRRAFEYAEEKGVLACAASGNEFSFHHNWPATYDTVMAVGGVTYDTAQLSGFVPGANQNPSVPNVATRFDVRPTYSDYGPHLELVAPTTVPTTTYPNGYTLSNGGTSSSAPHVCAVGGLVMQRGRQLGLDLSAGEVRQILRRTASDLVGTPYSLPAGWDRYTGYGRLEALEAVSAVAPGDIPPEVNITAPAWYQPVRSAVQVRAQVSARSYPAQWVLEAGSGQEPGSFTEIGSGTLAEQTSGGVGGQAIGTLDPSAFGAGGITLRLRVTDADGNRGEDRGYVLRLSDPHLRQGFPVDVGASGESSPQLSDVDGSPGAEIVLGNADGEITVLSGRTGRPLSGWPQRLGVSPGSGRTEGRIGTLRPEVAGTPAVADLDRDGAVEIVVAGLDGRVRVYDRAGRMKPGFPVRIDLASPRPGVPLDAGIYASPALGDLDGDGDLEIVVGAADQKVYAWDSGGRRLPGWPVLARDGPAGDTAKILSSPALGDVDGDRRLDVVEGTAEAYGATPSGSGRVYAFSGDGKVKPGWPVKPGSLAPNALPLAGEGVPMSPALADVDGDGRDEVAVGAFAGEVTLYRGDGSPAGAFQTIGKGARSPSSAPASRLLASNGAFGRLSPGGPLSYLAGVVDLRFASVASAPGIRASFEHLLGAWDARGRSFHPAFPRVMEGWSFLNSPAVADVDGASGNEVVAGSSGQVLHAFRADGSEPPGWPKETGGWMIASPAAGDVDGDGQLELVQPTREGRLFLWDLPARAPSDPEWPTFRHDPRNTGNYGTRDAAAAAAVPRERPAREATDGRRPVAGDDPPGREPAVGANERMGDGDGGRLPFTGLVVAAILLLGALALGAGSLARRA